MVVCTIQTLAPQQARNRVLPITLLGLVVAGATLPIQSRRARRWRQVVEALLASGLGLTPVQVVVDEQRGVLQVDASLSTSVDTRTRRGC